MRCASQVHLGPKDEEGVSGDESKIPEQSESKRERKIVDTVMMRRFKGEKEGRGARRSGVYRYGYLGVA